MKKLFFAMLLCLCIGILNNSCTSGQFQPETIKLSEDMEAYTALDENGDTLLGIRYIPNGDIVISPSKEWYAASVICGIIEIVTRNNTSRYFTTDGKPIGNQALDMLDIVEDESNIFYHGRGNNCSAFYFPIADEVVETTNYYIGRKYVCLQTSTGFDFRTYDGNLLWSVPESEFYLLKKTGGKYEDLYIAIINDNKTAIYTPEGKCLKELNTTAWNRLMQQGKKSLQIGSAILIDFPKSTKI